MPGAPSAGIPTTGPTRPDTSGNPGGLGYTPYNGSQDYGPYQMYDPSGGMGYGGASTGLPGQYGYPGYYGNGGYGGQSPYGGTGGGNTSGLDSLTAQAVALAQKQGQLGSSANTALGNVQAAQAAADASRFGASQGLAGVQNTNAANQAIATGNNATQMGLGQLGLQGQLGVADKNLQGVLGSSANQLAGTKYGADTTLAGLKAQIANSIPLQNAANAPAMATVGLGQDKLALFKQLMGSGGVGGVGIGSNPGQSGAMAGGGDPMNPTASGGAGGNGAPPLPQSQVINPLLLQRSINQSQNAIQKRYASMGNNMQQGLASRGFDTTGGLPPGIQEQMLQAESPELTNADLQWNLGAAGQNAGQSNTVAQMGLSQYNAQQDRLLRQQLANLGLLGGLIS